MCWVCEECIDNSHWACHYKSGLHTHTINIHKSYHKPDFFVQRLGLKKSNGLPNDLPDIAKLVENITKSQ